jgi:hypothetical protein
MFVRRRRRQPNLLIAHLTNVQTIRGPGISTERPVI